NNHFQKPSEFPLVGILDLLLYYVLLAVIPSSFKYLSKGTYLS
ncbi:20799_t:CDS:1, partial [Dentiscutata erythropus]